MDEIVRTMVLLHGGYHGAWCWQPLIEELRIRGSRDNGARTSRPQRKTSRCKSRFLTAEKSPNGYSGSNFLVEP